MKLTLVLLAIILSGCASRQVRLPLMPKNAKMTRCWVSQYNEYWECDYVIEGREMEYKHSQERFKEVK